MEVICSFEGDVWWAWGASLNARSVGKLGIQEGNIPRSSIASQRRGSVRGKWGRFDPRTRTIGWDVRSIAREQSIRSKFGISAT